MNRINRLVNKTWARLRGCASEEDGMGVVEIVLIILVLVALAVMFRTTITSVVKTGLASIKSQASGF